MVPLVATADDGAKKPGSKSPSVFIRAEWFELNPVGDNPTVSALRFWREVIPKIHAPLYSMDFLECDLDHLRFSFHTQKKEFMLGEPVLVELRIELEGPGKWSELSGGNYRSRGRDDNFLFLMRAEDGRWIPDAMGNDRPGIGGGVSGYLEVTSDRPQSYWLAVQQWCAIEDPGTYDLYCIRTASDFRIDGRWLHEDPRLRRPHSDLEWIRTPSPLMRHIPGEVKERAKKHRLQSATAFAHFRITIREPTRKQRDEMVRRFSKMPINNCSNSVQAPGTQALAAGIRFARQDDFVDLIADWISDPSRHSLKKCWRTNPDNFRGLALRSSPRALRVLFSYCTSSSLTAMWHLPPAAVPEAVPVVIGCLTDEDRHTRLGAERLLHFWTGKKFEQDIREHSCEPLTIDECHILRALWQKWWKDNQATFKPLPPDWPYKRHSAE